MILFLQYLFYFELVILIIYDTLIKAIYTLDQFVSRFKENYFDQLSDSILVQFFTKTLSSFIHEY